MFARKRFIESWLRWDELKQDEYLLPAGELKNLLSDVGERKSINRLPEAQKVVERPPVPKPPQLPTSLDTDSLEPERVRTLDEKAFEARRKVLQAEAEAIKAKYPATGREAELVP